MFAEAADDSVDAIFALSANFRTISPWCGRRCGCRTACCRRAESATEDGRRRRDELAAADELGKRQVVLAARRLAQELVELGPDQEDDRRDVEVRGDDDQEEQVSRGALVIRNVLDESGVDGRLDEPGDHDQ